MSGAGRRPRPVRKISIVRALGFVSRRDLAAMNRAERARVEVGRCLFVICFLMICIILLVWS